MVCALFLFVGHFNEKEQIQNDCKERAKTKKSKTSQKKVAIWVKGGIIGLTKGGEWMEPILIYYKKLGRTDQRMLFPKEVVDMLGREYFFRVYKDKIVLEPAKKERNKNYE